MAEVRCIHCGSLTETGWKTTTILICQKCGRDVKTGEFPSRPKAAQPQEEWDESQPEVPVESPESELEQRRRFC